MYQKLITKDIEQKLIANWKAHVQAQETEQEHDPVPVLKFFTPWGQCT